MYFAKCLKYHLKHQNLPNRRTAAAFSAGITISQYTTLALPLVTLLVVLEGGGGESRNHMTHTLSFPITHPLILTPSHFL